MVSQDSADTPHQPRHSFRLVAKMSEQLPRTYAAAPTPRATVEPWASAFLTVHGMQADAATQNFEHAFGNHKIQQENERAATAWGRDPNHGEHKPKTHVVRLPPPDPFLQLPVACMLTPPPQRPRLGPRLGGSS